MSTNKGQITAILAFTREEFELIEDSLIDIVSAPPHARSEECPGCADQAAIKGVLDRMKQALEDAEQHLLPASVDTCERVLDLLDLGPTTFIILQGLKRRMFDGKTFVEAVRSDTDPDKVVRKFISILQVEDLQRARLKAKFKDAPPRCSCNSHVHGLSDLIPCPIHKKGGDQ